MQFYVTLALHIFYFLGLIIEMIFGYTLYKVRMHITYLLEARARRLGVVMMLNVPWRQQSGMLE